MSEPQQYYRRYSQSWELVRGIVRGLGDLFFNGQTSFDYFPAPKRGDKIIQNGRVVDKVEFCARFYVMGEEHSWSPKLFDKRRDKNGQP